MYNDDSIQITDKDILNPFITKTDFPFLISFPRTGSHWLRMIMELYFKKPSLVRIFYFYDSKDFTCYHRHDENLDIEHENIIYLYRNPPDTIFSQINYYNNDIDDKNRIIYWSELYGKHLSKWLITENFTTKKTVISYDKMKNNMVNEYNKVCNHFNVDMEADLLANVAIRVTKHEVISKTRHDKRVINRNLQYESLRSEFIIQYSGLIMDTIYQINPSLKALI
jgi:hypothetical protein